MRKGGGSVKGSVQERKLCREFSLWFSNGQADDWFWRTQGSGSRQTTRQRNNKTINKYDCGDMKYDRPEGMPLVKHLNFEFRFRAKLEMLSVFYRTDPCYSFVSWWAKSCMESEQSDRIPVLVTKVNRGDQLIWLVEEMFFFVELSRPINNRSISVCIPAGVVAVIDKTHTYRFERTQIIVGFRLEDFFDSVTPASFVKAVQLYVEK
jgi:hypothetical protein